MGPEICTVHQRKYVTMLLIGVFFWIFLRSIVLMMSLDFCKCEETLFCISYIVMSYDVYYFFFSLIEKKSDSDCPFQLL